MLGGLSGAKVVGGTVVGSSVDGVIKVLWSAFTAESQKYTEKIPSRLLSMPIIFIDDI